VRPSESVAAATLSEGRTVPAVSLYLTLDAATLDITATESKVERVEIESNLRIAELETRLNEAAIEAGRVEGAHGEDLLLLHRLAQRLRVARGAKEEKGDRVDYTIRVADGRVSVETRRRGTPIDTLVAELMIHVNATWGRLLADRGMTAMYRNQRGIKTRMEVEPGSHEWLGVSHYAWSSSPLRRFSDLANQRQLVAALGFAPPPYSKDDLAAAARDFETVYEAYNEHQRTLERHWVLRYLLQEGIAEADATVIRDDLVRLEGLPLVCRAIGLPAVVPGEKVRIAFGEPDLWDPSVLCRYVGK